MDAKPQSKKNRGPLYDFRIMSTLNWVAMWIDQFKWQFNCRRRVVTTTPGSKTQTNKEDALRWSNTIVQTDSNSDAKVNNATKTHPADLPSNALPPRLPSTRCSSKLASSRCRVTSRRPRILAHLSIRKECHGESHTV